MKIIRILGHDTRSDIDFHPDSALLLPGRPLFYPDFGGNWVTELYAAVHINRLGKAVSEKFASRYYDTMSIAMRIHPQAADTLAAGVLSGMDSTITHGEWLDQGTLLSITSINISNDSTTDRTGDSHTSRTIEVTMPDTATVNRITSHISDHTTIRMGDLLLIPLDTPAIQLHPRTRLIITTPDRAEILNVKIV